MTRETKRKVSTAIRYTLLILVGFIMVYPLIWMVGATFKTNSEIFTSAWFLPKNPVFDGYSNAFKSYGGKISLITSLINTYKIVIPKVIFTVVSATIAAYGFGRFDFKGKKIFFALLMSTLFLPQVVLNAPQYIMFNKWKWVNTYLPLIVPSLFAADTYFVFMLIQFLRGVPKELEEAAKIDGCNTLKNAVVRNCPHAEAVSGVLRPVSVHVDQQRFPGPVDLHCGYAEIYELRIPAHVHGRRCWLPVEPYPGHVPDFHCTVADCVLLCTGFFY